MSWRKYEKILLILEKYSLTLTYVMGMEISKEKLCIVMKCIELFVAHETASQFVGGYHMAHHY